eukprot:jgi/Psemu1/302439/fgenesh1_kg.69_\
MRIREYHERKFQTDVSLGERDTIPSLRSMFESIRAVYKRARLGMFIMYFMFCRSHQITPDHRASVAWMDG